MSEEAFIAALIELGLDPVQVQVARKKALTFQSLREFYDIGNLPYDDAQIEAEVEESRRSVLDEYRQNGEEWERLLQSLDT